MRRIDCYKNFILIIVVKESYTDIKTMPINN